MMFEGRKRHHIMVGKDGYLCQMQKVGIVCLGFGHRHFTHPEKGMKGQKVHG
jgi:hypothetical protein